MDEMPQEPAVVAGPPVEETQAEQSTGEETPLSEKEAQVKQDMEAAAKLANQLVSQDVRFAQLLGSMLASRQLYAMCIYELELLVQDKDWKLEDVPELTESQTVMLKEILVNASAVQAQRPFDEKALFQGMTKTVFPWMQKVVDKHAERQKQEREQLFKEWEEKRLATAIDLGLPIEEGALPRQLSVLLVGEAHLLRWVTKRMLSHLLAEKSEPKQIVELVEQAPDFTSNPQVVSVPEQVWKGCTAANGIQRLYENFVVSQLSNPADVLLVHNIVKAYRGLELSPVTTRANEAQRKLKKWTGLAGALLVSCLPLERPLRPNELHMPEYEALRVHNVLRGVSTAATEDPEQLEVWIGSQKAATVPRAELESYRKSKIILT